MGFLLMTEETLIESGVFFNLRSIQKKKKEKEGSDLKTLPFDGQKRKLSFHGKQDLACLL